MVRDSYSIALEKKRLISAMPAVLRSLLIHNTGAAQYLHIYDLASSTPSGTPVAILDLPTLKTTTLFNVFLGKQFHNGILVANTTGAVTYSAGADDCWFTAIFD